MTLAALGALLTLGGRGWIEIGLGAAAAEGPRGLSCGEIATGPGAFGFEATSEGMIGGTDSSPVVMGWADICDEWSWESGES